MEEGLSVFLTVLKRFFTLQEDRNLKLAVSEDGEVWGYILVGGV